MSRQTIRQDVEPRMFTLQQGCDYSGMGRTNFTKWAREIGAVRKFGASTRFDKKIIDAALDAMKQEEVRA